jgi:hypothetical protein
LWLLLFSPCLLHLSVGEKFSILLTAKDHLHRPVKYGGDEWCALIVQKGLSGVEVWSPFLNARALCKGVDGWIMVLSLFFSFFFSRSLTRSLSLSAALGMFPPLSTPASSSLHSAAVHTKEFFQLFFQQQAEKNLSLQEEHQEEQTSFTHSGEHYTKCD